LRTATTNRGSKRDAYAPGCRNASQLLYAVRMSRRRRRRQTKKPQRPVDPEVAAFAELAVFREATRVKRLAYTRTQAAQALGISTSTFERRILPFIETVQMDWGKRFIPVDELERFLAERRRRARTEQRRAAPPGRKPGPHSRGAHAGQEPRPDRRGPQHGSCADSARRPEVVAFDRARGPGAPDSARFRLGAHAP